MLVALVSYVSVFVVVCGFDVVCVVFFVFFFKQKTAYEMRISDWSSDVCSSDLMLSAGRGRAGRCAGLLGLCRRRCADDDLGAASFLEEHHRRHFYFGAADGKKADFMHFRQCELAFNAKGGGKASTVYDAIGAAQVAKASLDRKSTRLNSSH